MRKGTKSSMVRRAGWALLLTLLLGLLPGRVTGQQAAGSWIAYVGSDGNVWVVQADGSDSRQLTADAAGEPYVAYCCLDWSPDGRLLAGQRTAGAWPATETQLWVYDVAAGTAQPMLVEPDVAGYDWMPNGTAIVYGRAIPEAYWTAPEGSPVAVDGLWQVDLSSGATSELLPPYQGRPLIRPQWSRGGELLAMTAVVYMEGSQPFLTYEPASDTLTTWEQVVGSVSLAPDASFLVYDRIGYVEPGPGLARLDSPAGAEQMLTAPGGSFSDAAPQVAPDGTLVAFLRGPQLSGGNNTLWVVPSSGGAARQVSSVAASYDYAWAPDSQRLVVTQRLGSVPELYVVDLASGAARLLAQGSGATWQPVAVAATPEAPATAPVAATTTTPSPLDTTTPTDGATTPTGEPAPVATSVAPGVTATGESPTGAGDAGVDDLLPQALVDAGTGPAAILTTLLGVALLVGGAVWAWSSRSAPAQEPLCARCGYPVAPGATFCGNCGQLVPAASARRAGNKTPGLVLAAAGALLLVMAFLAQRTGAEETSGEATVPVTVVAAATETHTIEAPSGTAPLVAVTTTAPPAATATPAEAAPHQATPERATTTATPSPTITPTPGHGDRFVLGYSVNGAPLEAIRAGTGPNVVVFVGGLHAGFAPASVDLAQQAARYFDDIPGAVPATATVYVVISANPDSPYNPGFLPGRLNARYVDLNRNWPCFWTRDPEIEGDVVPGAGGEEELSEPETEALADFLVAQQPRAVIVWDARAADGWVLPGECGQGSRVSQPLAVTYAQGAGFRWQDSGTFGGQTVPGDVTNWLDLQGIPAAYVLLRSFTNPDWERNLAAMQAVIDAYGR